MAYGGRLRLINAVIESMYSFWSQVFLLPKKLFKSIESRCRAFILLGDDIESRRALVAWEYVYQPRFLRGLGLRNISLWNKLAILKYLWNIEHKKAYEFHGL